MCNKILADLTVSWYHNSKSIDVNFQWLSRNKSRADVTKTLNSTAWCRWLSIWDIIFKMEHRTSGGHKQFNLTSISTCVCIKRQAPCQGTDDIGLPVEIKKKFTSNDILQSSCPREPVTCFKMLFLHGTNNVLFFFYKILYCSSFLNKEYTKQKITRWYWSSC